MFDGELPNYLSSLPNRTLKSTCLSNVCMCVYVFVNSIFKIISVHGQQDVIWVTPCERFSALFHRQLNLLFNNISVLPPTLSFCEGNQPVNGRFPSERASYPENVYIMMSSWCMLTVKDHVNIIELSASSDTINRTQLRAGNMYLWSVIWQTLVFIPSSHCWKCCNWYYHSNNTNISHFPGNLRLLFLKQASKLSLDFANWIVKHINDIAVFNDSGLCEQYVKYLGLTPSEFDFLFRTRPRALWQQIPPTPVLST